jgi:hypothetical protein
LRIHGLYGGKKAVIFPLLVLWFLVMVVVASVAAASVAHIDGIDSHAYLEYSPVVVDDAIFFSGLAITFFGSSVCNFTGRTLWAWAMW